MTNNEKRIRKPHKKAVAMSMIIAAPWCIVLGMMTFMMLQRSSSVAEIGELVFRGPKISDRRPCEEIYIVGDGETLQSISERCGDPFIVEENPHVHDPDDIFPGLVIKLNINLSDRRP